MDFYVGNRSLLPWNGIRDLQKRPILLRNSLAGSKPWFLSAGMLLYHLAHTTDTAVKRSDQYHKTHHLREGLTEEKTHYPLYPFSWQSSVLYCLACNCHVEREAADLCFAFWIIFFKIKKSDLRILTFCFLLLALTLNPHSECFSSPAWLIINYSLTLAQWWKIFIRLENTDKNQFD